jgi:hypothetical protein
MIISSVEKIEMIGFQNVQKIKKNKIGLIIISYLINKATILPLR